MEFRDQICAVCEFFVYVCLCLCLGGGGLQLWESGAYPGFSPTHIVRMTSTIFYAKPHAIKKMLVHDEDPWEPVPSHALPHPPAFAKDSEKCVFAEMTEESFDDAPPSESRQNLDISLLMQHIDRLKSLLNPMLYTASFLADIRRWAQCSAWQDFHMR